MSLRRRPLVPAARTERAVPPIEAFQEGPLAPFLDGEAPVPVDPDGRAPDGQARLLFAGHLLQDIADYRAALQAWHSALAIGGRLIVVVPHAFLHDRQDMLPVRRYPFQCRLYTPRSLADEIEEALAPNSYRLRWLGDLDDGYDYAADRLSLPVGRSDVAAVIERIAPPAWGLSDGPVEQLVRPEGPTYAFERPRTRIERLVHRPVQRILAMKLDHLGDFVVATPAFRRLRELFPEAHITLVVGSWNVPLALSLGLFDEVIGFDAFPRNSTEGEVDVHARKGLFQRMVTARYDLAVDLRSEHDTRLLLRSVKARLYAGIGTRRQFPFLDIFLPIDGTRNHIEAAWEESAMPPHFSAQGFCARTDFQISCRGAEVARSHDAIVWGPFRELPAGDYVFEPWIEIERGRLGILRYDVALDAVRQVEDVIAPAGEAAPLRFTNQQDGARFEFRLWQVGKEPVPDFRFFGGRLVKAGGNGVLHQIEYALLLVELIALRVRRVGALEEAGAPWPS